MNAARWQAIGELFEQALPLPVGERTALLDDALTRLAAVDERKCRIIELRYFAGFSVDETARALDVSVGTIGREQRLAEAWLHRELSQHSP